MNTKIDALEIGTGALVKQVESLLNSYKNSLLPNCSASDAQTGGYIDHFAQIQNTADATTSHASALYSDKARPGSASQRNPSRPSVPFSTLVEKIMTVINKRKLNVVVLWDSLGPSLALARSHITARLTVPYRSSAIGD